MSWFKKKPQFNFKLIHRRREAPDGLWQKCEGCGEILYTRELERNQRVCDKCGYHFKIDCRRYIELLTDEETFEEQHQNVQSLDPLGFRDSRRYTDRLKDSRKRTQLGDSVVTGAARIAGHEVGIGVMDFGFMGGTLGSATGEKLRRLIDGCVDTRRPLIIVSTSGGARMQEGILSLMQMAKTSVALARLHDAHVPFISILLNPTTAGVAASYASLGDIIIAEPGAQIGFAGPRVIQQTINQDLPEGFQTAEFVLEHGMIDMIVPRGEMRATVRRLIELLIVPIKQEVHEGDGGRSSVRDAAAATAEPGEPPGDGRPAETEEKGATEVLVADAGAQGDNHDGTGASEDGDRSASAAAGKVEASGEAEAEPGEVEEPTAGRKE